MFTDDFLGKRAEHQGAAIIPHPLPEAKQPRKRRLGKGLKIGKRGKELAVFPDHPFDLRLLEHDLGDQDPVGIFCLPPGKIAAVRAVVIVYCLPKRSDRGGRKRFHGFDGVGTVRKSGSPVKKKETRLRVAVKRRLML